MAKKVTAFVLTFLLLSISVIASASAPVQNRYQYTYTDSPYNDSDMRYRMNCYGYALQMYMFQYVSLMFPYLQMPGEFYANSETYQSLKDSYANAKLNWKNLWYFVKDRMVEDFYTFGWSLTEVYNTDQAPTGQRKILFATRQDASDPNYNDIHFYLQNSDGTWSHKPGNGPASHSSMETGVTITNSNVMTVACEGDSYGRYDDGIRIFLIGKDSVLDYPHYNGSDPSGQTSTPQYPRDKAGDLITKSISKAAGSSSSRWDYSGDRDWYIFKPTATRSYTITTSCTSAGYDIDGMICDSNGNVIVSDYTTSNASFTLSLTANNTYYITFYDFKNNFNIDYTLKIQ